MYGILPRKNYIEEAKRLGVYNPDNKLCLIVGTSDSWKKDFDNFKSKFPSIPYDIIAINKSLTYFKSVKHWCSKHPSSYKDAKWDEKRLLKGWDNNFKTHSCKTPCDKNNEHPHLNRWQKYIDFVWEVYVNRGSSGLFAAGCALGMGYKGAVLCGMELSRFYRRYIMDFTKFNKAFPDYLKSFSGYTNKHLGEPKKDWIQRASN